MCQFCRDIVGNIVQITEQNPPQRAYVVVYGCKHLENGSIIISFLCLVHSYNEQEHYEIQMMGFIGSMLRAGFYNHIVLWLEFGSVVMWSYGKSRAP